MPFPIPNPEEVLMQQAMNLIPRPMSAITGMPIPTSEEKIQQVNSLFKAILNYKGLFPLPNEPSLNELPGYLFRNLTNTGDAFLPKGELTRDLNPVEAFKNPSGMIYQAPFLNPAYAEITKKSLVPWRSKLRETVESKMPGQMPANALAAQVGKWQLPGEGPPSLEELKFSGLADYLQSQPGKVKKEDVLSHLEANDLRLEEVVKGQQQDNLGIKQENGEWVAWAIQEGQYHELARGNDKTETIRQGDIKLKDFQSPTKFSQYQLPGGENYREMLIKLPDEKPQEYKDFRDFEYQMVRKYGTTNTERFSNQDAEKYMELRSQGMSAVEKKAPYRSSHWDEPNVLAHIRFNDRTGPNGEKVLFIEELQSDWHQAGRKKGYETKQATYKIKREDGTYGLFQYDTIEEAQEGIKSGDYEGQSVTIEKVDERMVGVPDAPWKKTWPIKSIQRMVRYAAENGYDSISWTPGEVQADRYDLSKHIDRLVYLPSEENLIAFKDNEEVINEYVEPGKLEDFIGKEAAEKLINKPSEIKEDGLHILRGVDLKVGGEGMKGFYDKILPAEVNKFFNKAKYGNAKVGVTDLVSGNPVKHSHGWTLDTENGDQIAGPFASESEAKKAKTEVWTLPITPEMKEQAMKGFWTSKRATKEARA